MVDGNVKLHVAVLLAGKGGPEPLLGFRVFLGDLQVAAAGDGEKAVAADKWVGPEILQRDIAVNVEDDKIAGSG